MKTYILKDKIYIDQDNTKSFNYSDGDDTENYIHSAIKNAVDLSIGSEELLSSIKDWPTLYHLHHKRANLLRPLEDILKGSTVLEIGCGCGAITRYLGELDCQVTALEGSSRRASITAERCRDLPSVKVICDNFLDFSATGQFDVITLIGVLEYANLYYPGPAPIADMLKKVRTFLRPGGMLLIAIENKLGLKYWTGAPEDHTGQPYTGLENRYTSSTAVTFGKSELELLLRQSGFSWNKFSYPFPDYKLPHTLITDQGMQQDDFDAHMLLLENFEYVQSDYYSSHFSTSLVGRELEKNGLLQDLANSFLVIAGQDKDTNIHPKDILAYNYNTQRKKAYWKANTFRLTSDQGIQVHKNRLHEDLPYPAVAIRNILTNEPYSKGHLLLFEAIKIISKKNWTIDELQEWANKYYQALLMYSSGQDQHASLEGKYIDLTPFNIITDELGETRIFDQEWISPLPVPLSYVFFRGLNYSLGSISFFNIPADGSPTDILELSIELYKKILPFNQNTLEEFRAMELNYFSGIGLGRYTPFTSAPLKIRKEVQLEKSYLQLERELERLRHEAERFSLEKSTLAQEIQLATDTIDFYKNTLKKMQEDLACSNHKNFLLEAELEAAQQTNLQGQSYFLGLDAFTSGIAQLTKVISGKAINGTIPDPGKTKQQPTATSSEPALKQQIINLQNDILWYQKTYEERSMLGILKQKITTRFRK